MKTPTVPISYTKVIKKNRRHTILNLDGEQIVKFLSNLVDDLNRREKIVYLPEWYAKKMELI